MSRSLSSRIQNQKIRYQWSAWRFKCKKWGVVLNVGGVQQGAVVNVGVKFKRRWTLCHSGQVIVRFKCRWTLRRVGHEPSHPCNRPLTRTRWCLLQALNCQKSSWKTIFKDFKVDIDFAFDSTLFTEVLKGPRQVVMKV